MATDFLKINGWAIEVADRQATRKIDVLGRAERSSLGQFRRSEVTQKRRWDFTTIPLTETDAVALEGLLRGLGHHFDFEADFYSNQKGLGPTTGYGGTISGAQNKFGSYTLYAASGTATIWDPDYNADYSVSVWHYVAAVGAWKHLVITYDSDTPTTTKYINNVSGSTINNIVYSSGTFELEGETTAGAGSHCWYDDLVIVPYVLTTDQITAIYNSDTGLAFSDLPRLDVSGDILKTTTAVECVAEVSNEGYGQFVNSGTFENNMRSISFTLHEV